MAREVNFKIVEHIGVLSEKPDGWRKELNTVSWNGASPKYDIREWDPEHKKMSKGITLYPSELESLARLLANKKCAGAATS